MTQDAEVELAALRIVLANVVARLAAEAPAPREVLDEMRLQCKLAAEHTPLGPDRARVVGTVLTTLDEFFKGITIT